MPDEAFVAAWWVLGAPGAISEKETDASLRFVLPFGIAGCIRAYEKAGTMISSEDICKMEFGENGNGIKDVLMKIPSDDDELRALALERIGLSGASPSPLSTEPLHMWCVDTGTGFYHHRFFFNRGAIDPIWLDSEERVLEWVKREQWAIWAIEMAKMASHESEGAFQPASFLQRAGAWLPVFRGLVRR